MAEAGKAGGASGAAGRGLAERFPAFVRNSGALGGLLVLVALLSIASPDFLTGDNLLNVGVQASVVAILAFGMTFVIVSGGIDLSVGSVAGLSGIVTGWTIASGGLPMWLAVLLGLAAGAIAGVASGLLITLGRVPPFIATLAMLSVARGLALVVSDGKPITFDGWLADLGGGALLGVLPYPVLIMLVLGLLTAFILRRTYSGRAMYAIGGNREAARLSGIKVGRQQLVVYALSGLFAAVAGVLLAARLASSQPEAGTGYELDAIAAVVIGGASLAGGAGTALGTFVGALILGVLRNGLNLLDVSAFWQQVIIGLVIAAAVLSDTLRRRRSGGAPRLDPALRRGVAAVLVLLLIGAGWAVFQRQGGGPERPTVALSLSTLNNPFFVGVRDGAIAEARAQGVDLRIHNASDDSSQQADAAQNYIAQNVDAFIVNPVDSDAVVPSVRAANRADIPVVAVDRAPSDGQVVTTVASDNLEGGRLAAEKLAELVGSGPIAVLEGQPGTSAARDRGTGFTEGIAEHPGIEVAASQPADFDRTKGLNVTQNIVQANPDIKGVFAANDEMALGAAKALGAKAGDEVKVIGFDGTPEGLDAVREGTLSATVAQQPELLGEAAVRAAVKSVKDGEGGKDGADGADGEGGGPGTATEIPVTVVGKDEVEEFADRD
ncbi:monosaccharide ABC transporter substrate-binding protein (CUT2 family) /monosaccharide ABC transporter membrane protein (CUT2 family) [Murinocardiopsis flavida]|uniref:Monosaccharide ABC transporter substrate-binding protein (CUT2 family) /monosaccharide ABC transporter membrane protein (CUT2 family) n=1 Tax=Murinocardiopsis flavida TaxID=645275 RepID=A0A2P8DPE5_9ACTN|nr:substrate-binding domain-containing protein [Murinocardiopsis flavida]PSK99063.1 monosaccharide ABC transporter substrate-binding protein (CUT2 family) /monosaccharide ABC transporter membrane protein (CUT2 family) [Murinocardiopsis flavida]